MLRSLSRLLCKGIRNAVKPRTVMLSGNLLGLGWRQCRGCCKAQDAAKPGTQILMGITDAVKPWTLTVLVRLQSQGCYEALYFDDDLFCEAWDSNTVGDAAKPSTLIVSGML